MRKKLFKFTWVTIILAFCITLLPINNVKVEATEAYKKVDFNSAIVSADKVNLRSGPATTYLALSKLNKGEKLTVMGQLGDWYAVYVNSNGNVGAINKQYIKMDQAKTTTANSKTGSKQTTQKSSSYTKVNEVKKIEGIQPDEQSLLDMVNKIRKEKDLEPLEFDSDLITVARLKAKDMKDNNYFSHNSPFYGSPFDMMKKYGVKFSIAGENIAGNQNMERALKSWMDESSNNLFNGKFTHTGIGIVDSPTYGKLFVQMFIKK